MRKLTTARVNRIRSAHSLPSKEEEEASLSYGTYASNKAYTEIISTTFLPSVFFSHSVISSHFRGKEEKHLCEIGETEDEKCQQSMEGT